LSAVDMCEIARNSVLQSGFDHELKAHWIGNNYWIRSILGNDINQTNVPNIRIEFRLSLLNDEMTFMQHHTQLQSSISELTDPL